MRDMREVQVLRLGTDPSDSRSRPSPSRDTDGDGYTDDEERAAGTDPADPNSKPGQRNDTDQDGIPDASDPCPSDPSNQCRPQDRESTPGVPTLPQLQVPGLEDAWQSLLQQIGSRLGSLRDTALSRFPFGVVGWIPQPNLQQGSCPTFQVQIGPAQGVVNICSTPFWAAAQTYLRPALLAIMAVTLGFSLVRRALDVQR